MPSQSQIGRRFSPSSTGTPQSPAADATLERDRQVVATAEKAGTKPPPAKGETEFLDLPRLVTDPQQTLDLAAPTTRPSPKHAPRHAPVAEPPAASAPAKVEQQETPQPAVSRAEGGATKQEAPQGTKRLALGEGANGPTGIVRTEKLRALLNGARINSPLTRAVMTYPGLQADAAVYEAAQKEVTHLYLEVSRIVRQALSPDDDHPAVKGLIARPVAALVGDAWRIAHLEGRGGAKLDPERLAQTFLSQVALSEPQPETLFADLPWATEEALTDADAAVYAGVVLHDIETLPPEDRRLFLGMLSVDNARDVIRETLRSAASEVVAKHGEGLPEQSRLLVYKSSMESLRELYRGGLDATYKHLMMDLQKMTPEELEDYRKLLPEHRYGMLLGRTNEMFTQQARAAYFLPQPKPSERLTTGADLSSAN